MAREGRLRSDLFLDARQHIWLYSVALPILHKTFSDTVCDFERSFHFGSQARNKRSKLKRALSDGAPMAAAASKAPKRKP
eukprot:6175544-Pleurochrysis_carterae.AAC.2